MSLRQWWYRVTGQQRRDEIAGIRSMANRYSDAALSLMPEIVQLVKDVGIERVPWPVYADCECTPIRWPSLTSRTWRSRPGSNKCWGESGIQLGHAREHASKAFDYAESAINYAERAAVELNRAYCPTVNLSYASNSAESARDMALAAHRHMLQGQAAWGQYERLRAAELAPADDDLPAPVAVPVEQPIAVPNWPVRQRKEAQP